jgi:MFS family permease
LLVGPDPNYVWLTTAWTLALAVCSLPWGRLSDIFGRRWFLIGGNRLCLIGAIMGSCAQNVTTLIIGNAFVGLAVPAQLGFTIALAELVPKKSRGYLNAGLFCASLPFATFGTVIARALATNTKAGWRWCYYLNVITTILAIVLFFFFYHPPSFGQLHTRSSKIQVLKTLDYVSIFLFTTGLTLVLLSLSWGGQQYRLVSGEALGTLLGGVTLLAAFATWGTSFILLVIAQTLTIIKKYLERETRSFQCASSKTAATSALSGLQWLDI